jgi:uncharacterized protein involved in type VI secretion and phage assembly
MTDPDIEKMVVELTEFMRSRYFGKYRGIVQKVEKPGDEGYLGLGRIIAKVPSVYEDENSPWALPSVPFAGKDHGLVVLPEEGDGVWIEFEGGNPSCPIWTGCWWAKDEMPAPGGETTRILATSGGFKVVLDDKGKKLQLLVTENDTIKSEITMTSSDITLKTGETQIVLSASGVNINNGAHEVKKGA